MIYAIGQGLQEWRKVYPHSICDRFSMIEKKVYISFVKMFQCLLYDITVHI